ncbi:11103_t:CDS:2 [Ambispora gerdemannii]|uniref:11103_t:CDS:1 n=1 Tax=Ambispora gerdemannii TaxID=144530 RepID=A0A9N8ZM77_9GLOM|nr:11103_t:CDS:2 [Ambispora gerdemannii]
MSSSSQYRGAVKGAIKITIAGAKLVPGLEAAASIVQSIVKQAETLQNNRETCKELVERVQTSQEMLENYKPPNDSFQEAYKKYIDILKKIENHIKQLGKPGKFSQRHVKELLGFINADKDKQLLEQFEDKLSQAISAFNLELGLQIRNEVSEIKMEISNIAKGLDARPSDVKETRIDPSLITNDPLEEEVVGGVRKALVKKMLRSQPVAVRKLGDEYSKIDEKKKIKVENEMVIRKLLSDCNNIEKFYGIYVDSDSLYMVTEWVKNGNLCDYLQKEPNIPWKSKWRIASEIANAINFCHGVEVLHHNIRAENVLLNENLTAKLSNFDTSRLTHQATTTIPGIRDGLEWKAPEKIRSEVVKRKSDMKSYKNANEKFKNDIKYESQPFNKQMDVYSFGMTLWEIAANGKSPFSEIEDLKLEDEIIAGTRPLIPDDTPPAFEKFIKDAWNDKWDQRPKIDVIAKDLYINYQLVEGNSQIKNCLTVPSTPHYQRSLTPVPDFLFEIGKSS